MDPVTYVATIATIPGIFKSVVDCFEYVQFARHFGDDFGFCVAQLEAAEMQFSRWGEAMGFFAEPFDPDALYKRGGATWKEVDIKKAETWLGLLQNKFEDAKRISQDYAMEMELEDPEILLVPDQQQELDIAKPPLRKLVFSMRKITKERQKKTGLVKRIKWALYHKDHFTTMIENITRLVERLTALFPVLETTQRDLANGEVAQLDVESVPALVEVLGVRNTDHLLRSAVAEWIKREGHLFRNIEVKMDKDGFLRMGDTVAGAPDYKPAGMTFDRMKVTGLGATHAGHFISSTSSTETRRGT